MELAALLSRLHLRLELRGRVSDDLRLRLRRGGVWSGELGRGAAVRCGRGVVWMTQTHDTDDHVLGVGEAFACASRGKVVILALEEAVLTVSTGRRLRK